jgi:hypothetical protein
MEKRMVTAMVEKNKKIRLAAAKKTIAELEETITNSSGECRILQCESSFSFGIS